MLFHGVMLQLLLVVMFYKMYTLKAIDNVNICKPLPGRTFLDYESLLIANYVTILLRLRTHLSLKAVTYKAPGSFRDTFKPL